MVLATLGCGAEAAKELTRFGAETVTGKELESEAVLVLGAHSSCAVVIVPKQDLRPFPSIL